MSDETPEEPLRGFRTQADAEAHGKPGVHFIPLDKCDVKGCGAVPYWNGYRFNEDHDRAAHGVADSEEPGRRKGSNESMQAIMKRINDAPPRNVRKPFGEADD